MARKRVEPPQHSDRTVIEFQVLEKQELKRGPAREGVFLHSRRPLLSSFKAQKQYEI
jgi:hypothetical protein